MEGQQNLLTEPQVVHPNPLNAVSIDDDEHIDEEFVCCVCLDLLYKPIVLACGHMCCFWCVYRAMSGKVESHCPICRCSYIHFPAICQLLHTLLSKMFPVAYKRRAKQVLEEESETNFFSKQPPDDLSSTSTSAGLNSTSPSDLLCIVCKQLLFQPVVFHCGHVYCQSCITILPEEAVRCQFCQSQHPKGFVKVCLELDHFLVKRFPTEYALRRDPQGARINRKQCPRDGEYLSMLEEHDFSVHSGVCCDYCGMYPILGERYQCKDCVEAIGFDLCGQCYNSRSMLPGRFNQQHTTEHTFHLIESSLFRGMIARLATEHAEDEDNSILGISLDDLMDLENDLPFQELSDDALRDEEENHLPS